MLRWTRLAAVGVMFVLPFAVGGIFDDARIAQQNLRALAQSLHIYSNDNQEWFPLDPAWLYRDGIASAAQFWHPGDPTNRHVPTTINNSASNTAYSARISFDFLITQSGHHVSDSIMIRDNTPGNNGGAFINFVTLDGVIETDPPNAAPTPTSFDLAGAHLQRLCYAIAGYGFNHENRTPTDLSVFYSGVEGGGGFETTRSFWNPGDADPLPARITNSIPNGPESALVSFDYLTPNVDFFALPSDTVILRDNTPANNLGYGNYSAHADFTIRFTPTCPGEVIRDGLVDMHDLARLQANFGKYDDTVTPADGDIDASGGVFWEDALLLFPNLGNTCP